MSKTIALTGSDQPLYLQWEFNGFEVALKSIGGDTYYLIVPTADNLTGGSDEWTVRKPTDSIVITPTTTTGATGDDGRGDGTYTVADETVFRVGETLLITDSSDVEKGSIIIDSLSTNTISFLKKGGGSSFEPVSGDKIVVRADGIISEDDADRFKTYDTKYMIVNGSGSLNVDVFMNGLKKKY